MKKPLIALATIGLLLSSCSLLPSSQVPEFPPYEGIGFTNYKPTQKENLLRRSDFSIEVVRFTDARRPRSIAHEMPDQTIYEYEPDELIQGVSTRGPVLLNKYLSYRPRGPKHYVLEVDIRQLDTWIATGELFSGGEWGRYKVVLDVQVLARRPDSMVALNKTYRVELVEPRRTYNGRSPSKEMDRSRMYDMVELAFRQASEKIGWDIRQNDARKWKINTEAGEGQGQTPVIMRPTMPPEAPMQPIQPTLLDGTADPSATVLYPSEEDAAPDTDTIENLSAPEPEPLTPDDPSSTVLPASETQG